MVPKLIAFYLTQFHPTPENDKWWGKGFTEWTNVTKSKPLFAGHYQPHLPADFGFYDLRVRETRHEQIQIAKQYGIDGFCYHYYWFSGSRILNRPLDEMLEDAESDMPFCLCWANENWTRRWDAAEHEVLMEQKYHSEDDIEFIKSLIPFFKDPRYIKVDGAPMLIVYRPQQMPNAGKTLAVWRAYCANQGIDQLHICAALTHGNEAFSEFGFDSGVEFPPHNLKSDNMNYKVDFENIFSGGLFQYEDVATSFIDRTYLDKNVYRCVFPSWDNTARLGNRATIILNGTPNNYEYWLSESIKKTSEQFPEESQFVFINAWNEWAEGCHLEPDRKYQRQFLEATLRAKYGESRSEGFLDKNLPVADDVYKRTLIGDFYRVVEYHYHMKIGYLRVWLRNRPQLKKLISNVLCCFR